MSKKHKRHHKSKTTVKSHNSNKNKINITIHNAEPKAKRRRQASRAGTKAGTGPYANPKQNPPSTHITTLGAPSAPDKKLEDQVKNYNNKMLAIEDAKNPLLEKVHAKVENGNPLFDEAGLPTNHLLENYFIKQNKSGSITAYPNKPKPEPKTKHTVKEVFTPERRGLVKELKAREAAQIRTQEKAIREAEKEYLKQEAEAQKEAERQLKKQKTELDKLARQQAKKQAKQTLEMPEGSAEENQLKVPEVKEAKRTNTKKPVRVFVTPDQEQGRTRESMDDLLKRGKAFVHNTDTYNSTPRKSRATMDDLMKQGQMFMDDANAFDAGLADKEQELNQLYRGIKNTKVKLDFDSEINQVPHRFA